MHVLAALGVSAVFLIGSAAAAPACPDDAAPLLLRLNALRAEARRCGDSPMAAAAALRWDEQLAVSSTRYAAELARRKTLSHEGQVAATLAERLRAAGYPMRSAAENLASDRNEPFEALLQLWLASPAHCRNLMDADFRDAGLACVSGEGDAAGQRFWVLHLGRSREH